MVSLNGYADIDTYAVHLADLCTSLLHSIHAYCLEAMRVRPGNRVLDIGCGCGILTVMAAALAGSSGFAHGIDMNLGVCFFYFFMGPVLFYGVNFSPLLRHLTSKTHSGIGTRMIIVGDISKQWRDMNSPSYGESTQAWPRARG